jgi:hypothetical protein
MRIMMHAIFNKTTNEKVYTNARYSECKKKLSLMDNKEQFEIRYKWMSI